MHEAMVRILKDERGHLRNLFNQAPGFVAVLTGPEFVFEMANEAYYQLVGHREIIGKRVWDALPEVRGQGFEERLQQVYTTGEPWRTYGMPLTLQRLSDGPLEQRYIDLSYQAYRAEDGSMLGLATPARLARLIATHLLHHIEKRARLGWHQPPPRKHRPPGHLRQRPFW